MMKKNYTYSLECAQSYSAKDATENDVNHAFDDDWARGEYIILDRSDGFFIQAAGEIDDEDYVIEYNENDQIFRANGEFNKEEVRQTFLAFINEDPTWRTRHNWRKLKFDQGCFGMILILLLILLTFTSITNAETLPPLLDGKAPQTLKELWASFNPQAEPLETEILKEWEGDGVVYRVLRYRVGIFKGKKAKLAAIYGFPKGKKNLPGLVQIHGGGQSAHTNAVLTNAKRGYATISLAWAGRISTPYYNVGSKEVQLYWDDKKDDPAYRVTTDWGAVDAYHAPGKSKHNVFVSVVPQDLTLDKIDSPRNNGWFLCALAARRALTFLEQQPEVDKNRLGVYGHSMGGKLTVLTSIDSRVKVAAPSCGGISDRGNQHPLFDPALGDAAYLKKISCPIIFLSPANDFHGRITDIPRALNEIQSKDWRITASPHSNHQDLAQFEVATQLWFDHYLKGTFTFPATPKTSLSLIQKDGVPTLYIEPDPSKKILGVDVFYSQQGKIKETRFDFQNTVHRFWHHASTRQDNNRWSSSIPLSTVDQPLMAYANVLYDLDEPVTGAGYYYGVYTANNFNVSSILHVVTPEDLKTKGVQATLKPSLVIEDFKGDWDKEWFTYRGHEWPRSTHKIYDDTYKAPEGAQLILEARSEKPNSLVLVIDDNYKILELEGGQKWQSFNLKPEDLKNLEGEVFSSWKDIKRLKLGFHERIRPKRGSSLPSKMVGQRWKGADPEFKILRWDKCSARSFR